MSQTSTKPAKIIFQALKQFPFYSHLFPAQRAFLSLEAVSKLVFDIMLMKEFLKKKKKKLNTSHEKEKFSIPNCLKRSLVVSSQIGIFGAGLRYFKMLMW